MSEPSFTLQRRDKPLRILSTSDWHLGNPRVPAAKICERIRKYLFPKLAEVDLLNIGGDVWDTQLSLNGESNVAIDLIIDLLRECKYHNVIGRVLLGTYSHDRAQSSLFKLLQDSCQFISDFRYVDQISVEYIEALDLRILYLPDDLPYASSYACLDVVKDLMTQQNWSYVDYVFGHGYFDHMLPVNVPHKPKCSFKVEQFKPFVRRYVCMGHVHRNDFRENVFYNNSFDRLAHGEEDPKGFIVITDQGDEAKLSFVENKDATKFITLDLSTQVNKDEVGKYYLEQLPKLFQPGEAGYIRVIHPSVEVRQALHRLTNTNYPNLIYAPKKSPDDTTKDEKLLTQKLLDVKQYPIPSRATLPQMIHDFLQNAGKSGLSVARIAEILS